MSADTPAESVPAPPPRGDLPPLRIHHFLVCFAVAAVLLTWLRHLMTPEARQQMSAVEIALHSSWYVVTAAGFTIGAFSLFWRAMGIAAFSQPGQWLLLWFLLEVLQPLLLGLLATLVPINWSRPNFSFLWGLVDQGLPAIIYYLAVRRAADTKPWRSFFILCALGWTWLLVTQVIGNVSYFVGSQPASILFASWLTQLTFGFLPLVATLAMIAWALANDAIAGRQRSWTHWTGAGLFVAERLLLIALSFIR